MTGIILHFCTSKSINCIFINCKCNSPKYQLILIDFLRLPCVEKFPRRHAYTSTVIPVGMASSVTCDLILEWVNH